MGVRGAGTAGLVSAAGAAGLGARVALVEREFMGGDCLNVGCVPSKALIAAARVAATVRNAGEYEQWGYQTFEAYCAQELHIRKATADKLTRSYSFLEKHEPRAVTQEDFPERAPAFEVIEVLAGFSLAAEPSPAAEFSPAAGVVAAGLAITLWPFSPSPRNLP